MTEKRTGEVAPETIMCIFVELGRFLKDQTELMDSFDKTCYVFKNSDKWKCEEYVYRNELQSRNESQFQERRS